MRKVVAYELLSLDGVAEGPDAFFTESEPFGERSGRTNALAGVRDRRLLHPGLARGDDGVVELDRQGFDSLAASETVPMPSRRRWAAWSRSGTLVLISLARTRFKTVTSWSVRGAEK